MPQPWWQMARQEMSLVSFLRSNGITHVLRNDESQVETKVLEGKIVGLLFSVESNKSCSNFVNKLLGIYDEIQKISTAGAGGVGFEVVFVSGDTDEASFKQSMKKMPWLALPFDVKGATTAKLARRFKVEVMPSLVLVGSNGTTLLSRYGYSLVTRFGSKAFPFTQEHIRDLEKVEDQNASKLPVELKDGAHEHVLLLVKDPYDNAMFTCDKCQEDGCGWCYHCKECSYDLHLDCIKPVPKTPVKEIKDAKDQIKDKKDQIKDAMDQIKDSPSTQIEGKAGAMMDTFKQRKGSTSVALISVVLILLTLLWVLGFLGRKFFLEKKNAA
ncbi:probable nucleoredoxin 1 [Selaginella moellendorffii]|uniref:probable nucleoredoxin 1 n=1 Tax=Selaginella moellendorffii TaxID=88036 RepID=UPI000D1D00DF|nr:probable nucleoredoxin 1 [Selaginella moellendorffii]|eukprot:XP_024543006.1 probable nucleoredoxin 1 [Selaginella moellendorffii]